MASEVRDNAARSRYEVEVDGEVAGHIDYRGHGALRTLRHTDVEPAFSGRGVLVEQRHREAFGLPL